MIAADHPALDGQLRIFISNILYANSALFPECSISRLRS